MTETPKIWGSVTDPTSHNSENFRYLVHAINPFATSTMPMVALQSMISGHERPDPAHGDQSINLYDSPERLAERVSLSMSLIDEKHTGTWGSVGLIVEAPAENVLLTCSQDCGSPNFDLAALEVQARKNYKTGGDELLAKTSPFTYNEVVARANNDGKKLALKGFFYKTNKKGAPKDETLFRTIQSHARRLGLPIVGIKEMTFTYPNEIKREGEKLTVRLDDVYYHLTGSDTPFKAYFEDEDSFRFISRQQLRVVTDYMQTQGTDTEAVKAIEAAYEVADAKRQKTTVSFNDKGEVDVVKKRIGLGVGETEYVISSGGYARKADVAAETRKFRESMASMGSGRAMMSDFGREDDTYSPMTRSEVEAIVAEACSDLDAEQKAKVQTWLAGILPDVEEKSFKTYGKSNLDSGFLSTRRHLMSFPDRPMSQGKLSFSSKGFDLESFLGDSTKKKL